MIMILKLAKLVVHFPLSVFIFFRGKIHNLNQLSRLHAGLCVMFIIAASLFLRVPQAESSNMENLITDPLVTSLANTVTAYGPLGPWAVHFNPALLSSMGDGNYQVTGLSIVRMNINNSFERDPNIEEFHDFQGNVIHDPVAGREGSTTATRLYIPIVDVTLDLPVVPAPAGGFSFREPGSKWSFGYNMYMIGGGFAYGDDDNVTRFGVKSAYVQHFIYFGPGVSYRVNQNLSIGAALGVGQTAMGMQIVGRSPNEMTNLTKILGDATQGMSNPIFDVTGFPMPLFGGGMGPYEEALTIQMKMRDDFSPSFNLGVQWEPYDWLGFGLSYNSAVKSHLTGKYDFSYGEKFQNMTRWMGQNYVMQIVSLILDTPYQCLSSQTGTVTTDMTIPQMVNFGIKFKPFKRLSLMGDLRWSQYSDVKEYRFTFDQKIQFLQLAKFMGYNGGPYTLIQKKNWNDTLNWSVGAEYQALDWLSLRAGYEKRVSPCIPETYDATSLPNLDYYGAGIGIKGSALGFEATKDADIDFGLGCIVNNGYSVSSGVSENLNANELGKGVLSSYRGLNYTQKWALYTAGFKITTPLEPISDTFNKTLNRVLPKKWRHTPAPAKGSLDAAAKGKPVDSSAPIINNLRPEGKSYYIEDSE
jgi:long-subunit fatty acid transport protein